MNTKTATKMNGVTVAANGKPKHMPKPPSLLARYSCATVMVGVMGLWTKYAFLPEDETPSIAMPMHSYKIPLAFSLSYCIALPVLRYLAQNYFLHWTDMKLLLRETMILYNLAQVLLNAYTVYLIIVAVTQNNHPFVGETNLVTSGATYAVWLHYADKYLEFMDTAFMELKGRVQQVSFLHVYHHVSIPWAWWIALTFWPGGDCYFGALLNSLIHVIMYTHYFVTAAFQVDAPWKSYITKAQMLQFVLVIAYSVLSLGTLYSRNELEFVHVQCLFTQVFEMTSLLGLFYAFHQKSYKKKKTVRAKAVSAPRKEAALRSNSLETVSDDSDSSSGGGTDKKDQ